MQTGNLTLEPARRLRDVIESANAIASYTVDMNVGSLDRDRLTCDAVEGCLVRISGAVEKLKAVGPGLVPDSLCNRFIEIGDHLADYPTVRLDEVWSYIKKDLPPLSAACEDALRKLSSQPL
jgi:uncharacterized protein with HEPN domain